MNICPTQCIAMKPDKCGFFFPVVDNTMCVECGKCEKVCPAGTELNNPGAMQVYAAASKKDGIRKESSSGGIFYLLAKNIIDNGGVVYGAAFDEDFAVCHEFAETEIQLHGLTGSKYAQSRLDNTFSEVKKQLDAGRKVMFSGVPCQVQGLLNYLGKFYDNLLTVDLACHGVPSPKALERYIEYQEGIYGSGIKSFSFRNKNTGWRNYSVRIEFENGKIYSKPFGEDSYMLSFLLNYNIRECCGECRFRSLARNSDITLADFWDADKLMPDMDDDKGLSTVTVHSVKGAEMLSAIQENLNIKELPQNMIDKLQDTISMQTAISAKRNVFFEALSGKGFEEAYRKASHVSIVERIIRKDYSEGLYCNFPMDMLS